LGGKMRIFRVGTKRDRSEWREDKVGLGWFLCPGGATGVRLKVRTNRRVRVLSGREH